LVYRAVGTYRVRRGLAEGKRIGEGFCEGL